MSLKSIAASWTFRATAVLTLALGGVTAQWSCTGSIDVAPAVTPPEARFGLAENYMELAAPVVAASRPLMIVGAADQDNARKNVRLWDARIKTAGEHFANVPQQVGDCVSWGAKNAICYRLATQQALGRSSKGGDPYSPYLYGVARVTYGKGNPPCRSDGAVGAYAAEGFQEFGWLTEDEAGIPYSGKVARDWGCQGPPKAMIEKGRKRAGGDVAPVRDGADGRDAICNGYPVTVASSFGTRGTRVRDNRNVAPWDDRWPHQMCAIGYDGSLGAGREYVYIINSWGAAAHAAPLQGEPPGGFWVTLKDFDRICQTGDCWAWSDVPGFQAEEIDWSVFDQFAERAKAQDERIVHRERGMSSKTLLAP